MVKPFFKTFIPACLFLLILPASTLAFPKFDIFPKGGINLEQGQIRWGRIQFHPGFTFQMKYDDNIFQGADKTFANGTFETREEDVIFINKPSLGIELQRGPGEVFGFYFSYEGEDEHFLDLAEDLDGFNHDILWGVNFGGPGGRGDITIGGRYEKSNSLGGGKGGIKSAQSSSDSASESEPEEAPVPDLGNRDLASNIGNRVDNTTTEGFVDVIYALSKIFKLKFRADVEAEEFGGVSSSQNLDTYNIGGSFFWQATPIVAYGVKYNHRIIDFEKSSPTNDNSHSDQVYLALKWNPTKLIASELAIGYDTKRFSNLSGEDRQDLVFQIYVKYKPTKRTRLSMLAGREIVDSSFGTIQSYVHTSLRLRLLQRLGKKFKTDIRGGIRNRDYQRSSVDTRGGGVVRTRVDNDFTGSVALIYKIQKWLEAKALYRYEQTFSNFDDKDFRRNTGILEISAKY